MTVPDECQPEDVEVAVTWELSGGRLIGQLRVRNVGGRACRLSGKPTVAPLGLDGKELGAQTVMTLEWIEPGYVILQPGDSAVANIGWAGWDGQPASGRVIVSWPGGREEVLASGPAQPAPSTDGATNLWTSWFTPAPSAPPPPPIR